MKFVSVSVSQDNSCFDDTKCNRLGKSCQLSLNCPIIKYLHLNVICGLSDGLLIGPWSKSLAIKVFLH